MGRVFGVVELASPEVRLRLGQRLEQCVYSTAYLSRIEPNLEVLPSPAPCRDRRAQRRAIRQIGLERRRVQPQTVHRFADRETQGLDGFHDPLECRERLRHPYDVHVHGEAPIAGACTAVSPASGEPALFVLAEEAHQVRRFGLVGVRARELRREGEVADERI